MPNLNTGKPWSNWDDWDIRWGVQHGTSDEKIADFLGRNVAEVRERMAELGVERPAPKR